MNKPYFEWQSELVGSENQGEDESSLQHLLNSIPTDIPRNASEFDEELRNLIIALYSDQIRTIEVESQGENKGAKSLSEGNFKRPNYQDTTDQKYSPVIDDVSDVARFDGNAAVSAETRTHPDAGRRASDANNLLNDTKVTAEKNFASYSQLKAQNDGHRFSVPQPNPQNIASKYMNPNILAKMLLNNKSFGNRIKQIHPYLPSELMIERDGKLEEIKMKDRESENIVKDELCGNAEFSRDMDEVKGLSQDVLSHETNTKKLDVSKKEAERFAEGEACECPAISNSPSQDNENLHIAHMKLLNREIHYAQGEEESRNTAGDEKSLSKTNLIQIKEEYQQNLHELDDGKMAKILVYVSSWLSNLSNEPNPFETDSSDSLLKSSHFAENLPQINLGNDSKNAFENLQTEEISFCSEDCCIVDNQTGMLDISSDSTNSIELLRSTSRSRQHSLSIISEESDLMPKKLMENVEDGFLEAEPSSQSLLDLTSRFDSGIDASLATMGKDDDQSSDQSLVGNNEESESSNIASTHILVSNEFVVEPTITKTEENPLEPEISQTNIEETLNDLENQLKNSEILLSKKGSEHNEIVNINCDLENHIESLSKEYVVLVRDRLSMQKQLWDLEEILEVERKNNEIRNSEKKTLENQKSEMAAIIQNLELKLGRLEAQAEHKGNSSKAAIEKLNSAEKTCQNLMKKVEESEEMVARKTEEITHTQKELSDCVLSCKSLTKERDKYEADLKLVSDAFQKLKASKNWLEFQLKSLSESRKNMEIQFDEVKVDLEEKRKTTSRLQAENSSLSKKIVDMGFSSVSEKEELMRNMKKVEEEILKSQRDYDELEDRYEFARSSLMEKDDIVGMQEGKIKELICIIATSEKLEGKLKSEIAEKTVLVEKLEQGINDNELRLVELEAVLHDLKSEKSVLNEKCTSLESEVSEMTSLIESKDADLKETSMKNSELEKQITLAQNEKEEFEKAARGLKSDMQKVDRIFQVMKRDLAAKSSMLGSIESKKMELVEEMKSLQRYLADQDEIQKELRQTLQVKIENVRELLEQKTVLEDEVRGMRETCGRLEKELEVVKEKKIDVEEECQSIKRLWKCEEKKFKETIVENETKQQELTTKLEQVETEVSRVAEENSNISHELENTKRNSQMELAKLRAKENKLCARLKEKQEEFIRKEQNYEASVVSFVNKLKEESLKRQQLETSFKEREVLIEMQKEKQNFVASKIVEINGQAGGLKNDTNFIRRDVLQLKAMNNKLLNFVLKFVDKIKDRVSEIDCENKELVDRENTLKSELVRSRNFISLLEKQKVVGEKRNCELEDELSGKQNEILRFKRRLMEIEQERKTQHQVIMSNDRKAKENILLVNKKLGELSVKSKSLEEENQELGINLEKQKEEIAKLKNELLEKDKLCAKHDKSAEEFTKLVNKLNDEKLNQERAYAELQGTVFDLENQLGIEKSHGMVMGDSVKSLKWQLKQAGIEKKSLEGELESCKQRHQTELEGSFSMLNVAKTELKSLRGELQGVRKDKQQLHLSLIDSKELLRSRTSEYDVLRSEVCKRNNELIKLKQEMQGSGSAALRETVNFVVKKAIVNVRSQNGGEVAQKDKDQNRASLDILRKCMMGLRQEMNSLQSQMSLQMEHLQTSKSKFRDFDENFDNLQIACTRLHEESKNQKDAEQKIS